MNLTVEIPDDVAQRLAAAGGDLSRRALEALGLEEYKRGRLTKPELRRLLGFETRAELDEFFKSHEVLGSFTAAGRKSSIAMPASLDEGERAAIALAADIDAHLILLDDRDGVSFARAQGFAVTGRWACSTSLRDAD